MLCKIHKGTMQPELLPDINIYKKSFPQFGRPKIIGCIGLHNLKFARSVCDKNVNFDLNLHLENAVRKPQDLDVKLNDLLLFLKEHEMRLRVPLGTRLKHAKFFCYRGLMTCVACTPYENRESWKIVVILYKGNIYLCARDTEETIQRKRNMTAQEKRFTSWGYKFEQFILSDTPEAEPNPHIPVDENKEFSLIFMTNLKDHTVVYGAEMDGIRCDKGAVPTLKDNADIEEVIQYLSTKEFIELKTNRHIQFRNQETSFKRFKTKKWWCQSFLAGIDTILCGFRDDNGIVQELKTFELRDLMKMSQKFWDPNVCFNFLDTFFTYVKRCLARKITRIYGEKAINDLQSLPMVTLLLEWSPGLSVHVNENYNHDDDPILPEWFKDSYGKCNV